MIDAGSQQSAPPPPPGGPAGIGNPWEQRGELGYGAALLHTIKLFVSSPSAAYEQTLRRGDFLSPLLFGVFVGWFGAVVSQIWALLLQEKILELFPPALQAELRDYMADPGVVGALLNVMLPPLLIVVVLFISAGILHFFLMLVGALEKSQSGFEGTFRVAAYALVTQVAQIVPLVGGWIANLWMLVLLTIGAARLHDTTPGKAVTAVLLPLALCCLCTVLLAGLFFAAIMRFLGTA